MVLVVFFCSSGVGLGRPVVLTPVQSGHRDKNMLGLTRVPYDLRFS